MFRILALALASLSGLWAQAPASDWKTATTLPGLDLKSLTPAQQKVALTVLRESQCPCGCPMMLAQCRVEDPGCGTSQMLARQVVAGAAAGQTVARIRQALASSPAVKAAANRNKILLDPVAIPVNGAPAKGPAKARMTIVEFSDFQCPFCVRAVQQLEAVMKTYPNDVRMIYKQFPLESHSQAALAARASLAAHAQGKFWPLHDHMYANSRAINREKILTWAKDLGLDMPRFIATLDSPATKAQVDRDIADGERAAVNATPTIYLNGKKYQGSLEPQVLIPLIAAELKNTR